MLCYRPLPDKMSWREWRAISRTSRSASSAARSKNGSALASPIAPSAVTTSLRRLLTGWESSPPSAATAPVALSCPNTRAALPRTCQASSESVSIRPATAPSALIFPAEQGCCFAHLPMNLERAHQLMRVARDETGKISSDLGKAPLRDFVFAGDLGRLQIVVHEAPDLVFHLIGRQAILIVQRCTHTGALHLDVARVVLREVR